MTMRYEEAALAFDEEPAPDAATVEAHALPSERPLRVEESGGGWPRGNDLPLGAVARPPRGSEWILAVALIVAFLSTIGVGWLAGR